MLPKRYRLRRRLDVQRVRRQGRRWRHPLLILLILPAVPKVPQMNDGGSFDPHAVSRFAFAASRRVGNAVARNRAKRLLRAAVYANLNEIDPGWDCLFIAREETPRSSLKEVETAVRLLLSRAKVMSRHANINGDLGV